MTFDYQVTVAGQPEQVASGHTVHAALGRDGRPVRLPERIRKVFA
jgi:acyl-CoA thioesterase FadM